MESSGMGAPDMVAEHAEAVPPGAEPADLHAEDAPQRTDWWAEIRGVLWLVAAVLGFHSLVAKPFYIPSESMLPLLRVGDRLVVTKYPYGYSYVTPTFHLLPFLNGRLLGRMPERGDVVIVTPPGEDIDYIKRVIGLPGDRIAVRGGVVFLNGVAVPRRAMGDLLVPVDENTRCEPEHYPGRLAVVKGKQVCRLPLYRETLPNGRSYDTIDLGVGASSGDYYRERIVPQGEVFLMGDNRDNSADSRYPLYDSEGRPLGLGGPVPWENLGGRAEFITFSLDGSGSWNPLSWYGSLRPGRAGVTLRPQEGPR